MEVVAISVGGLEGVSLVGEVDNWRVWLDLSDRVVLGADKSPLLADLKDSF